MKLVYFAWVRERVGKSEEEIQLPDGIATAADLMDHLSGINEIYASAFEDRGIIRVAVNQEHVQHDHGVCDADEVAFFPPVTGG